MKLVFVRPYLEPGGPQSMGYEPGYTPANQISRPDVPIFFHNNR